MPLEKNLASDPIKTVTWNKLDLLFWGDGFCQRKSHGNKIIGIRPVSYRSVFIELHIYFCTAYYQKISITELIFRFRIHLLEMSQWTEFPSPFLYYLPLLKHVECHIIHIQIITKVLIRLRYPYSGDSKSSHRTMSFMSNGYLTI